jgi:hypothetical protein
MKYALALIVALAFAASASAQCNVRAQSNDVSAAAAIQQAQIQQLLALQAAPATTATATAGGVNPLAVQQLALLQAQQRAATVSALALPQVQPLCTDGSCGGGSRVRAASRAVTRPPVIRPARARSFSRSVSVSRA